MGAIAVAIVTLGISTRAGTFDARLESAGLLLVGGAVSSYMAMNFTGFSTYTSLSGVRREMRIAVPAQIACAAAGFIAWIVARFV